eukprot:7897588-Pyramimonas_sp.AAC.1
MLDMFRTTRSWPLDKSRGNPPGAPEIGQERLELRAGGPFKHAQLQYSTHGTRTELRTLHLVPQGTVADIPS